MHNQFCLYFHTLIKMKNILWLCSWYPNEVDKFRGDFVQRQAIAASQYCKIDVVHVMLCNKDDASVKSVNENLTESIFYLKQKNKVFDYIRMSQLILKWIKNKKYDLLHVQVPMPIGIIGLFIQKQLQIPFVVSEHYGIYNEVVTDNYKSRNFLFKFLTKRIFQQSQKIITVSEQLGKDIQREVLKKDFEMIPNVVDTTLFHFQEKKENAIFRFIHVSNMLEVKNIEGMLHAIKLLAEKRNDFEFYFVGAKPAEYLALAEKLNLNQVIFFLDEMPYHQVATEIHKADAGVLFSFSESQSCVVLEWLCAGLPVIASEVGGVTELITNENGILVESNNTAQLAMAMNELIENKSNYHPIDISKKAIEKYSYESVGKKINEIYKALIH